VTTLTYGLRQGIDDPENDAAIAKRVSEKLGVQFRFWATDEQPQLPLEQLLDHYLEITEGKGDRLNAFSAGSGYLQRLNAEGITGAFQGDVSLSKHRIHSDFEARHAARLYLLSDYANLPDELVAELPAQPLPAELARHSDEAIQEYLFRLLQQFRYPTRLANMNDTRSSYIEIINPLMVHSVVRQLQTLPFHLRIEKRILRLIEQQFKLDIPYASREAVTSREKVVHEAEMVRLIRSELASPTARLLFPDRLISFLMPRLKAQTNVAGAPKTEKFFKERLFDLLPASVARWHVQRTFTISPNLLAWRVYVINRSYQKFNTDSRAL